MSVSLIQLGCVNEEGAKDLFCKKQIVCKVISLIKIMTKVRKEAPANTRASSRGKTRGASVIRNDWA